MLETLLLRARCLLTAVIDVTFHVDIGVVYWVVLWLCLYWHSCLKGTHQKSEQHPMLLGSCS